MTTIYLVRHAQSESNAKRELNSLFEGKWGQPAGGLTEKGRQQAHERKKSLAHVPFDAIFASDTKRARQTAEILASERDIAVQVVKGIEERSFYYSVKSLADRTREEITQLMRKGLKGLSDPEKMQFKITPDQESATEAAERLHAFLRKVAKEYKGKTVLVVNHGNNIRSLLPHLGLATFDELPSETVDNTAYLVFETDGEKFHLKEEHGVHRQKGKKRVF
jgi:broad specificity phosphatase PhoE